MTHPEKGDSMSDTEQLREAWIAKAHELGQEHARNAASWTVEAGRYDVEAIRAQLQMMEDGDPRADEHLPARPNLSGEWADSLTPLSLAEEIIGYSIRERTEAAWCDVIDALAEAYEQGVLDTFEDACETELRKYLPTYTVKPHTAPITGASWFIVVDDGGSQVGPYYSDHEDAQAAADDLNAQGRS